MRILVAALNAALFLVISAAACAGSPVELARGEAPQHPQQPQIAVDDRGAIHVAFGVRDVIRYARSDDGGKTFSSPVALPAVPNMSLGMRRGPRIAAFDSAICITAIGGKEGKGRDGDIWAFRSTDGGRSWTEPVSVNDVTDSAREGLHAMAAGPRNVLCCTWLDLRNRRSEIMSSISTDGGATWGKNVLAYRSPDGSVCECCHPSVTFDPQGRIYVQWRNSLAGARDMYVATSSDGGATFGNATKLGTGSWPLSACPMDGGAIAVVGTEKIATAWRRDKSVYLFVDGQPSEVLLGGGEQPWIAATPAGPYVVWLTKRGDSSMLLTPGAKSPVELAAHANDPVIATGPNGRGPVVVAWESRAGSQYGIQCQVVTMGD